MRSTIPSPRPARFIRSSAPIRYRDGACLYLGRRRNAYVDGLPLAGFGALLDEIWSYASRDEFTWYNHWRAGDFVLWDNRCTMHRRDPFDPDARRIMHRTQVKGETRPAA